MHDLIFFSILAIILVFKLRNILGKDNLNTSSKDSEKGKAPIDITFSVMRHKSNSAESTSGKNKINDKNVVLELSKPISYSYTPSNSFTSLLVAECAKSAFDKIEIAFGVSPLLFIQEFGELFIGIFDSYNSTDLTKINGIVSKGILDNMLSAIRKKSNLGLKEQAIIVKIINIFIEDASFENEVATVSVLVESEQIHYVSDKDNNIIEGSNSVSQIVKESFTIVRHSNSENSTWIISEIKGSSV